MKQISRINVKEKLRQSLLSTIENFKDGNDYHAIEMYLYFISNIEKLLDIYEYIGKPKMNIDIILRVAQTLYRCMQNQDIIGMVDVLEYTIYPLIIELHEENDEE